MFLQYQEVDSKSSSFMFGIENFIPMSPVQVNEYLRLLIEAIQKSVPLFRSIHEHRHYVIVGTKGMETALVLGSYLMNFSIAVTTLAEVRAKMIAEGVPSDDKVALCVAIEESYDESVTIAYSMVHGYASILSRAREVSQTSRKKIIFLLKRIHKERIHLQGKSFMTSTSTKQRLFQSSLCLEDQQQFGVLARALRKGK